MKISFSLNGREIQIDADPSIRLVDLLRNELDLDSLHPACYSGRCGNCAILLNGSLVYSCLQPAFAAEGAFIHTYEGLRRSAGYEDIIYGLEETGGRPCNYCLPSKVVIIQSILENTLHPTVHGIYEAFSGTYCPCTNYKTLAEGIRKSAELRRKRLAD